MGDTDGPAFAEVGGVRIRIHHLGGRGPAMLCVHATGFHGRLWEPFVPRLRERYSVVALDQRGHGDSDKPEAGYDWENFGRDALGVVEHLGLKDAVGVGHSAGATALIFAETLAPGTFSRLVLMDPTLLPPEYRELAPAGFNPMSEQARRRRAIWDSVDQMVERLRSGTPLAGWQEEYLRAYVTYGTSPREDGTIELKCPPEIEAQVYAMAPRHDGWERLERVRCPTLVLTGTTSHMWAGERAELVAGRVGTGRAETIEGGHFFPMENPEPTIDRVLAFLDETG